MIEYIKGEIKDLTPTYVIVENGGIGYYINISLTTYTSLANVQEGMLYIYESIREDAHLLYGFVEREERDLFLLLISVSGVGANTARVILSSLSAIELQEAIACENYTLLKNIKGIGLKTAQRIVVDLKDKIQRVSVGGSQPLFSNSVYEEAKAALTTLGFTRTAVQKVLDSVFKENPATTVEQAIKLALKML